MNSAPIDHYLDQRYISWSPQRPDRTTLTAQTSIHTRPIFVGNKQLNPALNKVIKTMQQKTNSSCSLDNTDSHLCTD